MLLASLIITIVMVAVACFRSPAAAPVSRDPLEVIPAGWIDLPDSPFIAAMHRGRAVLVNRSGRSWDSVTVGCLERQGDTAHVLRGLFSQSVSDGLYRPGDRVDGLLRTINNIDYYVANEESIIGRIGLISRCPAHVRIGVTHAAHREQSRWSAEGTPWPRD